MSAGDAGVFADGRPAESLTCSGSASCRSARRSARVMWKWRKAGSDARRSYCAFPFRYEPGQDLGQLFDRSLGYNSSKAFSQYVDCTVRRLYWGRPSHGCPVVPLDPASQAKFEQEDTNWHAAARGAGLGRCGAILGPAQTS